VLLPEILWTGYKSTNLINSIALSVKHLGIWRREYLWWWKSRTGL